MNEKELALNAAIFAVSKIQDKGSSDYAVIDKDRIGKWNMISWSRVIRILYDMLKEIEDAD